MPLHGVWRLVGRRSPWPRRFLGMVARIAGVRTRSRGTPLPYGVIFVANHSSWLDIPVVAGATGSAFVAKAELAGVPLIGWLCGLNRTIFVSRTDRMAVSAQIGALRAALDDGWPVTLFPEGTTSGAHDLLPFKPALLAVLEPPPPGVRVQPIVIDYGGAGDAIAWTGAEPGTANARRILSRGGRTQATLTFLEPFVPEGGRKAIAAEARARIAAAMACGRVVTSP